MIQLCFINTLGKSISFNFRKEFDSQTSNNSVLNKNITKYYILHKKNRTNYYLFKCYTYLKIQNFIKLVHFQF